MGLRGKPGLSVADIGCGTGASTLVLADELDARLTAVDFLPEFLQVLAAAAARAGVAGPDHHARRIDGRTALRRGAIRRNLGEGAIYNIGFAAGAEAWRRYLKPGGVLAVSELSWLTATRPAELQAHWDAEYPEVDTAAAKMAVLERLGYTPIGYFPLPESCWLDGYYRPMQGRFAGFLDRHHRSAAARAIVAAEEAEIGLYERNRAFVSYGYYIARKTDAA
ncbi:MAG: class I SAM-dependent methyltransferase [Rhodobacteraceae bacterium]|nr:class I SAM-dependent methyltransferase [Paracoccaceae bacterium]